MKIAQNHREVSTNYQFQIPQDIVWRYKIVFDHTEIKSIGNKLSHDCKSYRYVVDVIIWIFWVDAFGHDIWGVKTACKCRARTFLGSMILIIILFPSISWILTIPCCVNDVHRNFWKIDISIRYEIFIMWKCHEIVNKMILKFSSSEKLQFEILLIK